MFCRERRLDVMREKEREREREREKVRPRERERETEGERGSVTTRRGWGWRHVASMLGVCNSDR